jgi:uncharacterized protein
VKVFELSLVGWHANGNDFISMPLPPLIAAMSRPDFYPHSPASVELRQTHISWVLLAGERVYKVKKRVRFPFLDYSTLARRRFYCQEEVRLNRRLAEGIYLGVVAIVRHDDGFALGGPDATGAVEDYAVEMRRFAEENLLERRVLEGRASQQDVERVADRLVAFHRDCSAKAGHRFGSPAAVARVIQDNVRELRAFVGQTIPQADLGRVDEALSRLLDRHRDLIAERARFGRVREGHGDLRAEHVLVGPEISIVDCVEFSERLRICDVASEVAFLAMDLRFLRRPDLAEAFVARYGGRAEDPELCALLPLYEAHRALVRAKVESLRAQEGEVADEDRARARERARRYVRCALRDVHPLHHPALLVVCGLSGSGKSTVARMLEDLTGFALQSSDVVRKELAGAPAREHAGHAYGEGLYAPGTTAHTYTELLKRAERALEAGTGAILDATFKDPAHRHLALELAERHEAAILFVECRAQEAELRRRFAERRRRTDEVSDATWEVYLHQRGEFVPLREISAERRISLDTGRPELDMATDVERVVERVR